MLYYWAKTYVSQLKRREPYTQLKKMIQIIITDFFLLPLEDIHSKFQLLEPYNGMVFSDHLEIHVVQLPTEQEKGLQEMNELEKWLLFFKGMTREKGGNCDGKFSYQRSLR